MINAHAFSTSFEHDTSSDEMVTNNYHLAFQEIYPISLLMNVSDTNKI